jgi:hypothetical protein
VSTNFSFFDLRPRILDFESGVFKLPLRRESLSVVLLLLFFSYFGTYSGIRDRVLSFIGSGELYSLDESLAPLVLTVLI